MSAHLTECDGQCGDVCQDRYYATLGGAPRVTLPLDPPPYVPVPIAPDAARDARVAARRRQYAVKAGRALDRYMDTWEAAVAGNGPVLPILSAGEDFVEAVGDYVLSRLQHNRAYGVTDESAGDVPHVHPMGEHEIRSCSRVECHNMGGPCDYCGGAQCRVKLQHNAHYGVPETVSCPLCPATSQDLAAHYADYHPGHVAE